ncbi:hypothetical protein TRAPUB_12218 [Trametes pubescens]|uniref:Uncharacterized protein n=1 Tax=Trametes pubescens TaxID=154538 RepID=A0A1M2VUJ7_TRAPU|nr:hypothetical protein TRAPUB_12218 [Trametes pubescens]
MYTPLADSTQLLLNTPTPTPIVPVSGPITVTPPTSSSSNPGGFAEFGLHTPLLVSLTAVLGVTVVAIAVVLCWMRQSRRLREPLASGRARPGTNRVAAGLRHPGLAIEADIGQISVQQKRTGRTATVVTSPVLAPRAGSISDDSTIVVQWGGGPGKEVYQVAAAAAEGGIGAARPPTIRSTADTDGGSVRAPSLRARFYAFFAGARTGGGRVSGSVEDGRDAPPAYEPHVLPEYGAWA